MAWQSSTINPTTTTPADDISKIENDLTQLRAVLGGASDVDIPFSAGGISFSYGTTYSTNTVGWALKRVAPADEDNVTASLAAAEGVPATDGYRWSIARGLVVPTSNTANRRYWTIIGSVDIPAGATIPAGDVRHDHLGVRGQATSASINSRIWGGCFLAQVTSPATNNTQIGQCLGTEIDVNNGTGYDVDNLGANGDVGGLLVASGGANAPRFAICVSKLGSAAGFYTGLWFREGSIRTSGFGLYFGNVAPAKAIMFGEDYTGGAAIETKAGMNALQMRTTSGPYAAVRSVADRFVAQCGYGGYEFKNADNNQTLARLSNAGVLAPKLHAVGLGPVNKTSAATSIDASVGSVIMLTDAAATTVTTIANGSEGQELFLVASNSNTTIAHGATIKLSGGLSWTMPGSATLTLVNVSGVWYERCRKST